MQEKKLVLKIFLLAFLLQGSIAYADEKQLDSVRIEDINIEELFYKKHLNTDYKPIKLEASLTEPIDLSIQDIIAKAVENNLNLKIAKQNTRAAKWKFWNKFGDLLPDLNFNLNKQNRDGTFYLNSNFQSPIDETIASAGMRLNYRAFNGGASTFLTMSEKYFREATNFKELSQYNLTLLDSVTFYLELLKAQASLSSNLKSLERAQANYELVQKFLKAGNGTKFELLQADAQRARAQQELINQEANFRNAEINLSEHLNIALSSALHINSDQVKKVTLIDETIPVKEFLKTSFKENPDIQAALRNKRAIAKQSLSTYSSFLPTIDLYFDLSGTGAEWSDLFSVATLGFDANYTIGEGLGVNAVSRTLESKANLKRAELEYLQEMQRIEKALRVAYLNFQRAKSILEASHKEYIAAKEAYRLSQLRYKNGLEILTNLIQREEDLSESQLNLINATTDYNLSQVRMAFDMGIINSKDIVDSGI